MPDDVSPRRPHDPPWRSRTARRSLDPAAARALRRARLGWSVSEASRRTGVSRRMIKLLEQGQRRPSVPLAEALIRGYGMSEAEAGPVRAEAVSLAGRDSPYRQGWRPSPANYGPQRNGGQPVLGPRRTAPQARQEAAEPPQGRRTWSGAYAPPGDGQDGDANPWAAVYSASPEAVTRQRLEELRSVRRA